MCVPGTVLESIFAGTAGEFARIHDVIAGTKTLPTFGINFLFNQVQGTVSYDWLRLQDFVT